MADKFIFKDHYDLDWEDIERKVQIISRRFQNIDPKYREDMEQELRLFAFTTSSHYQHMYRKAIDYWRHLTVHVYPEVCIFDMEDSEGNKVAVPEESYEEKYKDEYADKILKLIDRELNRYAITKKEEEIVSIAKRIMEIITYDIYDRPDSSLHEVKSSKYRKGRMNISWLSDQTGYDYKKIQRSMDTLMEIVRTLFIMGKIDTEFAGYFK